MQRSILRLGRRFVAAKSVALAVTLLLLTPMLAMAALAAVSLPGSNFEIDDPDATSSSTVRWTGWQTARGRPCVPA